jgi:NTE family protein
VNFNALASEHFLALPMAIRSLLRNIGIKQHSDSSLASYLLFEKNFTKRLIELGYQDAMVQMDELMTFLAAKN